MTASVRRARKGTRAARADKYALYQRAVQVPEFDVDFIRRVARRHSGRVLTRLREDFCGTALLSSRWVAASKRNHAWGIDLDAEPLAWGEEHNRKPLGRDARRLHLVRGDVLHPSAPPCDVVVAGNFSFYVFQERALLLAYFRGARAGLRRGGLLIADMFGGPEGITELVESRRVGGFTYEWEQSAFDPIASRLHAHISFRFPDGSVLARAFSYDWRVWTIPEVRELMLEAGFREVHVYWELTDARGNGTGVLRLTRTASANESFVASLVARA